MESVVASVQKAPKSLSLSQLEKLLKLDIGSFSITLRTIANFTLVALLIVIGYIFKHNQVLTAESGTGYWLGIIGGSMMLLLLIYPIRKKMKTGRYLGSVRFWFKTHMLLGVLGPIAVLYHSNFSFGSMNSSIALICMLIVAISGFIGRYFYSRIHQGLYGRKLSLTELAKTFESETVNLQVIFTITPELKDELAPFQNALQQNLRLADSIKRFFVIGTLVRLKSITIPFKSKRAVKAYAAQHNWTDFHTRRYIKILNAYVKQHLNTTLKVCEFSIYERLFALWHTLHLPLFIMMLVTGIIHIVAVHMY